VTVLQVKLKPKMSAPNANQALVQQRGGEPANSYVHSFYNIWSSDGRSPNLRIVYHLADT
jgi:hypothetical protein